MDLKETGCESNDLTHMDQDRIRWQYRNKYYDYIRGGNFSSSCVTISLSRRILLPHQYMFIQQPQIIYYIPKENILLVEDTMRRDGA
jgi:hypothetical protein